MIELQENGFTPEGLEFFIDCHKPKKKFEAVKGKRIYIAGPITSKAETAESEFEDCEKHLKEMYPGVEIANPFKLPHEHDGEWSSYMREDIAKLVTCSHIYLMEGWRNSKGARLEYRIAAKLGIIIIKK